MKKNILVMITLFICLSCNDRKQERGASAVAAKPEATKAAPVFDYPIRYKDWEIGDPENTRTALKFYKYWDEKKYDKVHEIFADSVRVRIPGERNENIIINGKIDKAFQENRNQYNSTNNDIISAVSLHDKESGQDWVLIVTYNRWTESNGKRDSLLYSDYWQLKNGKLYLLMSYEKMPTTSFLKQLKSQE